MPAPIKAVKYIGFANSHIVEALNGSTTFKLNEVREVDTEYGAYLVNQYPHLFVVTEYGEEPIMTPEWAIDARENPSEPEEDKPRSRRRKV